MNRYKKAIHDPTYIFEKTEDVLDDKEFTIMQKINILRQWEYDERDLEVAEEENMGGDGVHILDKILRALHDLHANHDVEKAPPTKQGG